MLVQSPSCCELQTTVLHIAPMPHVVEHWTTQLHHINTHTCLYPFTIALIKLLSRKSTHLTPVSYSPGEVPTDCLSGPQVALVAVGGAHRRVLSLVLFLGAIPFGVLRLLFGLRGFIVLRHSGLSRFYNLH